MDTVNNAVSHLVRCAAHDHQQQFKELCDDGFQGQQVAVVRISCPHCKDVLFIHVDLRKAAG